VRFNREGTLLVPWGYVGALQSDPTEKKPFYHLLPGSETLTFGMLGCDFHCSYCQNWVSSQALRDPASDISGGYIRRVTPEEMIGYGVSMGASVVGSSYNEPLITSEWAVAVFKEAQKAGLKCVYVSNGNATPEVLDYLGPYLNGFKIDLKTMQDKLYRSLGGVLQHVLDSIKLAYTRGIWVEIVTLVVPGFNDSTQELMDAARYIASVSPDIPWHVTAFHKDYKMTEPPNTTVETLIRAAEIGQEAGLRYVYAGNLPGRVAPYEDTLCPSCGEKLVERFGYVIRNYHLTDDGTCPKCGTIIAGIWPESKNEVRLGPTGDLFSRRPRPIR
jgi:pyruvate formate lyase activating enzyme